MNKRPELEIWDEALKKMVKVNKKNEKAFVGGAVAHVDQKNKKLHIIIPNGDWNSLYPNVMITYHLDGYLLVMSVEFANIPGVKYLGM